jgi:hypothetical protein
MSDDIFVPAPAKRVVPKRKHLIDVSRRGVNESKWDEAVDINGMFKPAMIAKYASCFSWMREGYVDAMARKPWPKAYERWSEVRQQWYEDGRIAYAAMAHVLRSWHASATNAWNGTMSKAAILAYLGLRELPARPPLWLAGKAVKLPATFIGLMYWAGSGISPWVFTRIEPKK